MLLFLSVLLVLGGVLGTAASRWAEKRRIDQALARAGQHLQQEQATAARQLLEETLRRTRATSPRRKELTDLLAAAQEMELTQQLKSRFAALTKVVLEKDWDGAAQFATPECKMRLGLKNISLRMAVIGAFAQLLKVTPDSFRIRELRLNEDRQRAVIIPELRLNNVWTPQQPTHWHYVEQQWWLYVE